jgi:hypothetical protein
MILERMCVSVKAVVDQIGVLGAKGGNPTPRPAGT